jgi:predicted transcriptional regulator
MSTQYKYSKEENNIMTNSLPAMQLTLEKPSIPSELSITDVLSSIFDEKALSLFKAVALSENDCSSILITKLRLTRKQYYSNMEKLVHAGLVKRTSGKYRTTSFGKVILSMMLKIETAIKYHWKLNAIDSIMMMSAANDKELPLEERQKIIDNLIVDNLIDGQEIKDILVSKGILITQ